MDTPKLHVLTIMWGARKPLTQEQLTDIAEHIGYTDTPQSLRSRMAELERSDYVRRIDRNGISRHNRPCWRWKLTKTGHDYMQIIFDITTPNER